MDEDSQKPSFKKLEGSISPSLMGGAHVLAVGSGGANGLYEDLARCGLGRLTVIDFDRVDSSNIVTQGFSVKDVGRLKVEALEQKVLEVNPDINFRGIERNFLHMSEEEITELAEPADLLLSMTDDFFAQARGNRVGLKFQLPAVFAIVYEKARCAEITFTIPGVTPGCHRCAVSSRYQAYTDGFENDVVQQSTTVFHCHYLNSCLGLISLALLHRDSQNMELGDWFGSKWERNLVQIRMHPSYGTQEGSIFEQTVGKSPRIFNFDSVWQLIEAEAPPKYSPCPDCGGGGDLRNVRGIVDTMPKLTQRSA